ncbi:MFS transporter [Enterococcus lemanii]|uniref:MFS transporter n=1 Tax=Enterococcus lemanii TaxID=1159752 RepID=A0ABV9MVG0_9ENTE|nr:MFS transporter [Enterococcus lemanii]MBM7710219.1 MFS family permease [Enterococcus lemanii]
MKNKGFLFKLSLLSISLLLTSANAISMTIPQIQAAFPNISATTVESLVTIPSFTMMVFVLLSGFISSKIGSKKTVLIGLILTLIGGVIPVFALNFTTIYFARFIFGAGLGCYNSLAVSLINDFYEGDEKQDLIGYQSAMQSLGSSLATFIAGILAVFNWQYAFSVYFLAIPVMVLFYFVVPETKQVTQNTQKEKQRMNMSTIFYTLLLFTLLSLAMIVFTKVGSLVSEAGMSNSNLLGTALSLMTLAGFISGLLYGKIYKVFKTFTPVVGGVISTLSFLLLAFAPNIYVVSLSVILMGFCQSLFIPYIFGALLSSAHEGSQTLAISVGMVGSNLGSFASPYLIAFIMNLFGRKDASFAILIAGIGFLILTAIFFFDIVRKKERVQPDKVIS